MPRYKFVATQINRAAGERTGGFQQTGVSTSPIYLDTATAEIGPNGTNTLIIDKVTRDQYIINKAYSAIITILDTASASPANALDFT